MILGIGTDLVEVARVERALGRWGERFARKILVPQEMARFFRHRKPAQYLAKRFAAKEAFSKAMGTGIHHPVNWLNVGVANLPSGQPVFQFSTELEALMRRRHIRAVHVTLTDERALASATVILEGDANET